ncbi:MAG TPA: HAD-IIIA family hydrolase [Actinophytocola sp.]|uniref:D-glycero-alpha-D-manno-heptose-1,7-bisphosphate 7-phosphatase n=1 Tax=Actinophytocola sp. TaxID=1872138 RepID=UPI002DDDA95C|nr:HAD-IIIA family hydrolase [Actinophytocola sp.]HEV2778900.1 HAD-IIIA family hydrolase [Actinophytocola sp.]
MNAGQTHAAVRAVLFDRDGTLVEDVPYNADPALVRAMPGAREALDQLRLHGVRTGVVTNQSGVGRGLLTVARLRAVNARIDELLGRFSTWQVCPHRPDEGCACRKPRPGLVLAACAALDVRPVETVVIGDTGADVDAARAAGARAVLVPNPVTRPDEIDAAPAVADNLVAAVRLALSSGAPV